MEWEERLLAASGLVATADGTEVCQQMRRQCWQESGGNGVALPVTAFLNTCLLLARKGGLGRGMWSFLAHARYFSAISLTFTHNLERLSIGFF